MLYTGIRINELLKIETKKIHLDERYFITGSKTDAGKDRIIPIAKPIEKLIRNRYNKNNNFLIMKDGKQLTANNYRQSIWNPAMKGLHMNHLPHDCRHTFCSISDRAGMDRLIQQRIVGHKAANITEQVYIHKKIADYVQAIDKVWPTYNSVLATC